MDVTLPNVSYVVADKATGKIAYTGNIPNFMLDSQIIPDGLKITLGVGTTATHYVRKGVVTERPAFGTVLNGHTILNVPNGATVTVDGVAYGAVTDGQIDLAFNSTGDHTVVIQNWPYKDRTYILTA